MQPNASSSPKGRRTASRAVICPRCGTIYPGDTTRCPADGTPLARGQATQAPMQRLPDPGTRIHNYRLLDVLGEGSMGRVYLAENETIQRLVALKMLHPTLLNSPGSVEHFLNEARTVNQVHHANIIEVTDFIITDDGAGCFLVMERLDGTTLEQLLRLSAPLSIERTLLIAEQIASALAAAHRVGVVHRDLKPGNVFLLERAGTADFVKVIDFGVAKVLHAAASQQFRATMSGTPNLRYLVGTPAYMSPEQSTGGIVDHRADIYAVGVLLYEMVTGKLPFGGDTLQELLEAHCYIPPEPPSQVSSVREPMPPALEQLILHCLAKAPSERPQRMESVSQQLQQLHAERRRAHAPSLNGETAWDALLEPDEPRFGDLPPDYELDDGQMLPRRRWPVFVVVLALVGLGYIGYGMLLRRVDSTQRHAPTSVPRGPATGGLPRRTPPASAGPAVSAPLTPKPQNEPIDALAPVAKQMPPTVAPGLQPKPRSTAPLRKWPRRRPRMRRAHSAPPHPGATPIAQPAVTTPTHEPREDVDRLPRPPENPIEDSIESVARPIPPTISAAPGQHEPNDQKRRKPPKLRLPNWAPPTKDDSSSSKPHLRRPSWAE